MTNDLEIIENVYEKWNKEKYSAQPSLKLRRAINNSRKNYLSECIPNLIQEIKELRKLINDTKIKLKS